MCCTNFLLAGILFSAQVTAQITQAGNMFRQDISHSGLVSTSYDLIYDMESWRFYAGAPVRSTSLAFENSIYFGDAKGDFFCVDTRSGQLRWRFHSGKPIHSSAATDKGRIFFADNEQAVYALRSNDGGLLWRFIMAKKLDYPWRFDYYYSSPLLYEDKLFIGGDDGFMYALEQQSGQLLWKFQCKGLVRSTPAVFNNMLLFGDTEATFYAVDIKSGNPVWKYAITGDTLKNEKFGFDRRAITSSATISQDKVLFGARDGYLYALRAVDGKFLWKMDHKVSWVVSTPAVKDSIVVTGTSDGHFIQGVHLQTGKEIWRFNTPNAIWTSPLINNEQVYAGGFDGRLYCLDLRSGRRISQFAVNDIILSSPVIRDSILFFGADDGYVYALKGRQKNKLAEKSLRRFVFYEPSSKIYFRNGSDGRIKASLEATGFRTIASDSLPAKLGELQDAKNTVIVFASIHFPALILQNGKQSLLRKFLDEGGRVVLPGFNSMLYKIDDKTKQPYAFNVPMADSVLGLDFGPNDTRAIGGLFPSLATKKGKEFNLPTHWISAVGIDTAKVDIILGKNENGLASAFVKFYRNKGAFVQVFLHPDLPENMDALVKLAEWEL